ncbi:MAG: M24 family metallopeptidase [Bacillus subtilis]|nr:M24 family metallopeptidase [Bacillus subtilis]
MAHQAVTDLREARRLHGETRRNRGVRDPADGGDRPRSRGYNGFPAATCVSINEVVVHGIPGSRLLKEGDIVSIDIGANYKGYHGDSAWTYPVGTISDAACSACSRKRRTASSKAWLKPSAGNRLSDISHAIQSPRGSVRLRRRQRIHRTRHRQGAPRRSRRSSITAPPAAASILTPGHDARRSNR